MPASDDPPGGAEGGSRGEPSHLSGLLFVGYHEHHAVATAAAWVDPDVTLVEVVATRPSARGRGFGGAVTTAAAVAGSAPAALISSDRGYPGYRRLGFETIGTANLWIGHRG